MVTAGGRLMRMPSLIWTSTLAVVYPGAVAVTIVSPWVPPYTCGVVVGVVDPAGNVRVDGVIVILPSLSVRVTVKPPAGAAVPKVTGNAVVWFIPTE
jgi:hypothetical protein